MPDKHDFEETVSVLRQSSHFLEGLTVPTWARENRFSPLFQRLLFNHVGDGALPRSDPNLSAPEKGRDAAPACPLPAGRGEGVSCPPFLGVCVSAWKPGLWVFHVPDAPALQGQMEDGRSGLHLCRKGGLAESMPQRTLSRLGTALFTGVRRHSPSPPGPPPPGFLRQGCSGSSASPQ